jgi:hypothetical protein
MKIAVHQLLLDASAAGSRPRKCARNQLFKYLTSFRQADQSLYNYLLSLKCHDPLDMVRLAGHIG